MQKRVAYDAATIVSLTRQVKEKQAQAALAEISAQPTTWQISVVLRVLSWQWFMNTAINEQVAVMRRKT